MSVKIIVKCLEQTRNQFIGNHINSYVYDMTTKLKNEP